MILYDSRAANSSSPRIRRAKTPFAQLCSFDGQPPLPQPPLPPVVASHPSAVMRPKLFCPISRKRSCNARTSLVRALLPVPPLQPPQKGFQRGPCPPGPTTSAVFASLPSAVMHEMFLDPISRKLSCNARISFVRALLPVPPLQPPQKGLQRGRCAATTSAVLRPKFLAQSHTFSRNLSLSLVPFNPFNRRNKASNMNPF